MRSTHTRKQKPKYIEAEYTHVAPRPGLMERAKRKGRNYTILMGLALAADAHYLDSKILSTVYGEANKRVTEYQVQAAVMQAPQVAIDDIEPAEYSDIFQAARAIHEEQFRIPRSVWKAVVQKESGNGSMYASRFEAHHMERVKKYSNDPHERKWLASSWCAFQVMGWHVPELNKKYNKGWKVSDLATSPKVCAEASALILSECAQKDFIKHEKNSKRKLEKIGACYNGSEKYGKEIAQAVQENLFEGFHIGIRAPRESREIVGHGMIVTDGEREDIDREINEIAARAEEEGL